MSLLIIFVLITFVLIFIANIFIFVDLIKGMNKNAPQTENRDLNKLPKLCQFGFMFAILSLLILVFTSIIVML